MYSKIDFVIDEITNPKKQQAYFQNLKQNKLK